MPKVGGQGSAATKVKANERTYVLSSPADERRCYKCETFAGNYVSLEVAARILQGRGWVLGDKGLICRECMRKGEEEHAS